ncbi:uncharacterized protein HRG_02045 [Hirsutella rhossiliensis]|uniref:Uncharacterized protein n=1 Tax=Hirsutella rhossiliensis TaxID=111463 RepID=A0A9P8SMZ0_9HYPO|nr:uncharacterized protein HRG_02045 [Hirsutella rhossiliensis]KAH0966636.1 hypothetical protein HRG_02045 [Hirsutella rhossiliensis]
MSIFSHIRKSRQQAKEHNAKVAEQEKKEQQKVPWRELDRPRILEENRRRSAMAASGHHMNMPGAPRIGSSLSHVTYPGEDATPMARLPRANSYTGVSSYADRSREAVYPVPHISYSRPTSFKGKEVVGRWPACDSQRASPTPSKVGEPSPVESSSGSTGSGSQDDLEIKPTRPRERLADSPHRLHPSRPRRTSDSSIERVAAGKSAKGMVPSNYVRDSRPPPSMRGFASIAQVAAPPPVHSGFLTPPLPSQTALTSRGHAKGSSSAGSMTPRQNSTSSLPSLTPTSSRVAASAPGTPAPLVVPQAEYPLNWASVSHADSDKSWPPSGFGEAYGAAQQRPGDKRMARTMYASEFEPVNSTDIRSSYEDASRLDRGRKPPPLAHEDVVNVFPEQASLPEPATPSGKKKGSKGGGKIVKKSRWSSSKASAVVV